MTELPTKHVTRADGPSLSLGRSSRGFVLALAFVLFSIPFGEWQRIALDGFSIAKLVLPAVFLSLSVVRPTKLRLHPHLGLIVAFVVATTPSFLLSDLYQSIFPNLLGYIVLFVVLRNAADGMDDLRCVLLAYALGLAIVSALAIVALVVGLDFGAAIGRPLVEVWYGLPVVLGTENNPNAFATLLVPGAPIALFLRQTSCSRWKRAIFGTCFLLFILVILLTYSRSGIAGAGAATTVAVCYGKRRALRAAVLATVIFGALSALLIAAWGEFADADGGRERLSVYSNKELSQGYRLQIAEQYLPIIADHPLLGVGYGNLPPLMEKRTGLHNNSHNMLAGVAIEFGLVAALLFATLIVMSLRAVTRGVRAASTPVETVTGACIFGVIVGLVIHGMFHETYVNLTLWSFVGLGGVYATLIRNARRQEGMH